MQDDWKEEIGDRMEEIRVKENVSLLCTVHTAVNISYFGNLQELHNLEVNLVETQREQKLHEQRLQRREAELAERELTLLQRELNVMMAQQQPSMARPTPNKRKGKFKKKMLLKKESSNSTSSMISGPSGLCLAALITDN